MKKRILILVAWLFSGTAAAAPADNEQIAQLLDYLGVREVIEQAPAVLGAAISAQAQQSPNEPTSQNPGAAAPLTLAMRRDLEAQLKPQALSQAVTRYLRERYNADMFERAQRRLQEPLAKRARYFDLAMTQPGAEKNLRDFLRQSRSEPAQAAAAGIAANNEARRTLLREIDTASATSSLMATLQSAIAARLRGEIDATLLRDAIVERQRFLAPLAVDYLFYDYRYLRDDELRDYRDLWRDDAVQALLDMGRQALLTAIVGEVTLPPPSLTPLPGPPQ